MRQPVRKVEGMEKRVGDEVSSMPGNIDASDLVAQVKAVEGRFVVAKRLLGGRM